MIEKIIFQASLLYTSNKEYILLQTSVQLNAHLFFIKFILERKILESNWFLLDIFLVSFFNYI